MLFYYLVINITGEKIVQEFFFFKYSKYVIICFSYFYFIQFLFIRNKWLMGNFI